MKKIIFFLFQLSLAVGMNAQQRQAAPAVTADLRNFADEQVGEARIARIRGPVDTLRDEPAASFVKMYPNPASAGLYVVLPEESAVIKVYDTKGRCWLNERVSNRLTHVDLTGVAPGNYILEVRSPKRNVRNPFIIQ